MMSPPPQKNKNKTIFCLLIVTLFTLFFFARSVIVRERWIVPTWMSNSINGTAHQLHIVNNWLEEGIIQLGFGAYVYPSSVERPTLDKRWFYASYPPAATFLIYLFFKFLDFTNLVPDIYDKRGTQLLMLILLNYLNHFLLVLVLCGTVFFVCRKTGFDNLNSTLFAIVPAIIQFHNANSLYWHHLPYYQDTIFMLPFALYVLLELLRIVYTHSRLLRIVAILQSIVAFFGILINWLFGFIILTIYIMRMMRKEINAPTSLPQGIKWVKQSLLFFAPFLTAIVLWAWQVAYYAQNIAHTTFLNAGISSQNTSLLVNFLHRTGIADGFGNIMLYLKTTLYKHVNDGYGISGVLLLYGVFFIAAFRHQEIPKKNRSPDLLTNMYFLFFVPCLAGHLFFIRSYAEHRYSSLVFSPALSISFVLMPILISQIMEKSLTISIHLTGKKSLTVVALIALSSSTIYGYAQIYNKQPVTKMFHPPVYHYATVGNFLKKNTGYRDIVFSNDYRPPSPLSLLESHFSSKTIYYAHNLDHIYYKIKYITSDFTIKVFYLEKYKKNTEQLEKFLITHDLHTSRVKEEMLGGILAFDGQEFIIWYEQMHEGLSFER